MAAAGHDDVVSPRRQLPHISSLEDVVAALAKAKKVVVLAGAGISVSCGIPDFRSKDGIYDMVQEMDLGLDDDPQCLFDLEFFMDDPEPFYRFAHKLYPKGVQPSATHHLLARLEAEGKLRRLHAEHRRPRGRRGRVAPPCPRLRQPRHGHLPQGRLPQDLPRRRHPRRRRRGPRRHLPALPGGETEEEEEER